MSFAELRFDWPSTIACKVDGSGESIDLKGKGLD